MSFFSRTKRADEPTARSQTPEEAEISRIHDRFKLAAEASQEQRRLAKDDLEFRQGDGQWPAEIKNERKNAGRPCHTINRLPQFERQITNDLRKNRPAGIVSPVKDGATQDTAEVLQGLIRHIEYQSNADVAYDTAATAAVRSSFGYFRVITDYAAHDSFDQEIYIKRIRNAFTVYFDPSCQEPDYSDAKWAFIVEDIPLDTFKGQYPKAQALSAEMFSSIGNASTDWYNGKTVRIAEYFEVQEIPATLYELKNGMVVVGGAAPNVLDVKQTRETTTRKIVWKKLNGVEVLEETEWLGRWIPIVPVLGDELDIDGKVTLESITRHAKDPQRQFNYMSSAETEMIGLAPKAPYVGVAGQFTGFENKWNTANVQNYPYLEYNNVSLNGTPAPAPQRSVYEPAVQAITAAKMQAADDLKATTGIYDSALGSESSEKSGKAILARQNQTHTSNFHFGDNLSRAIKHLLRIILDLIPKIYDAPRIVRIVSESGEHSLVKINQPSGEKDENGVDKIFDVTTGKYDVVVHSGPSYDTKRQEAAASMEAVIQAYPGIMEVAGDLLVQNFDWPGSRELSARLKKALPPQLQDDDDAIPPAVKGKIAQGQQMVQQLTQALNEANQKLENKQMENESRERIAAANNETAKDVAVIRAQADLTKTLALLEAEMGSTAFAAEIEHLNTQLQAETKLHGDLHKTLTQSADAQANREHQADMAAQQPAETMTQQ